MGLIWTYWAPLGFVLAITLIREAYDDFQRMLRDREINGALYCKHTPTGIVIVKSANIKVGLKSFWSVLSAVNGNGRLEEYDSPRPRSSIIPPLAPQPPPPPPPSSSSLA